MTASIHVMDTVRALAPRMAFYDSQGDRQREDLLSDPMINVHNHGHSDHITAGMGHIVGNAGGNQTVSVDRFMDDSKVIHVGETVEWTTDEAVTSHTITFGFSAACAANCALCQRHHRSGWRPSCHHQFAFRQCAFRIHYAASTGSYRSGTVPLNGSATRFRVTFAAGVYQYKCVLHDDFGMVGQIIVLP